MLDINLFRVDKGGNPDLVRESQRKRGASTEVVDEIIKLDREWVKHRFDVDELNKESRALQLQIAEKIKAKEDASQLIEARNEVVKRRDERTVLMNECEAQVKSRLCSMGNLVHASVVDSKDEKDNDLVRTWSPNGVPTVMAEGIPHHLVLHHLDGYDAERGAKVVGHRGYFLRNAGLRLNQALINYGLDFLAKRQYTLMQTPFMMRRDVMAKCAQLEDFDEQLYKVSGDSEDLYLIATSEQPITAYHCDEWFDEPAKNLPIRYAGYSTCFRKEAGSHGKDTWGIFRIHQFEKVEQFCLTEPEKSWEMFDEMIGVSEAFYQSLLLPYRIVGIVSGALNNAASKKYDLEAWFPVRGDYRELVSCSNCTDYHSRRLEIRCGLKKMGDREKKYVHCLNSTLCATERTLCCILENYQTPDGLRVPDVLQPYLGGQTFIPYVKARLSTLTAEMMLVDKQHSCVLYSYWRSSCSWRVRLALEWKGIAYEYKPVNLLKREQQSPDYLAVNPAGLVPALTIFLPNHEQVTLCQSVSIMEYLEEAFPNCRHLLPKTPLEKASVRRIVQTIASDIQPLQNLRVMNQLGEPEREPWAKQVIGDGLRVVEQILKETSGIFCVGDSVTLADLVLVPQVFNAGRFNVDLKEYPLISAINDRLASLVEFQRAHPSAQPDCPK